jgi:hypothetical protein
MHLWLIRLPLPLIQARNVLLFMEPCMHQVVPATLSLGVGCGLVIGGQPELDELLD